MATDEIANSIAGIESRRLEAEKAVGSAAACVAALRSLQQMLSHWRQVLRLRGQNTGISANITAIAVDMARVRSLAGGSNRPAVPKNGDQRKGPRQVTSPDPARNRGHVSMGRGNER